MPQPKKRHTNSRQNKRRFSNYTLKATQHGSCPACGAPILPHHACPTCGSYKGRIIKKIKVKDKKKGKA